MDLSTGFLTADCFVGNLHLTLTPLPSYTVMSNRNATANKCDMHSHVDAATGITDIQSIPSRNLSSFLGATNTIIPLSPLASVTTWAHVRSPGTATSQAITSIDGNIPASPRMRVYTLDDIALQAPSDVSSDAYIRQPSASRMSAGVVLAAEDVSAAMSPVPTRSLRSGMQSLSATPPSARFLAARAQSQSPLRRLTSQVDGPAAEPFE